MVNGKIIEIMCRADSKGAIIVRGACLAHLTLERLCRNGFTLLDFNKQRVDQALLREGDASVITDTAFLKKYVAHDWTMDSYIMPQHADIFAVDFPIKAVIIDSYSELVDVRFIRKGASDGFCATFSDIKRGGDFFDRYEALGRLNLALLTNLYRRFFNRLFAKYGAVPIVYLPFPSKYERRNEFLERHRIIMDVISALSLEFTNLYVIKPDIVEPNPFDDLIYHYSDATYDDIAHKIATLGIGLQLKRRSVLSYLIMRRRSILGMRKLVFFSKVYLQYWNNPRRKHRMPVFVRVGIEPSKKNWFWQ